MYFVVYIRMETSYIVLISKFLRKNKNTNILFIK